MNKRNRMRGLLLLTIFSCGGLSFAQQPPSASATPPRVLTLRQAVAQAVAHSNEITLARLRYEAAEKESDVSRSQFMPNVYAGSGVAYTSGFPLAAGGGAPAVLTVSYTQSLFNPLASSDVRVSEQHEEQMRLALQTARENVILRVASSYLELSKLRRSRELLNLERESAARILAFTRQRANEGLELPIEVTKAQLTAARIEQGIAKLENADEVLSDQLRTDLGLPPDTPVQVQTEDLPAAEPPGAALLQTSLQNSIAIKQAASEREASAARLQGERGSRWPTISLTGQYNMLARFNNYDEFFNKFVRNNFIVGAEIKIPIFAAHSSASFAAARANFAAADMAVAAKRSEVLTEVRQKSRQDREANAAREVARLELDLAQQNTAVVQAQFNEGRASLRDLESAQLQQNDKWLAFLDADFARQQAQLQIMREAGQLPQLAQ